MQHRNLPDPTAPGMSPVWFVLGVWGLYAAMAVTAFQAIG